MENEMSITAIKSIPLDMRKELSDPHIPWGINKRIFNEMKSQGSASSYKKVQVLPTDTEWCFVCRYFHQDKPNHYGIKRVYCIYERHQQQAFELNLSSIEREATKFKPKWCQEPRASQRAKSIERWKQSANVFSPFSTMELDGRRRSWEGVCVLPLWYGSSEAMCESIAKSGFNFGKISTESSTPESIDEGFFGNGIYFTNSARYASDIYSKGHVFLAWVSMREPFPIIGDTDQIDMKAVKEAYKDYNALYIPVTSINPSDPYETVYYPTKENETPHCDEFIVFHKSQTLPRFWVELEVEIPYVPSGVPQCVNELIPHLSRLLQNPNVNRKKKLLSFLCRELGNLLILERNDYLEERHKTMYEQLNKVLNSQWKVNIQIRPALTRSAKFSVISSIPQSSASMASTPLPIVHQPITSEFKPDSMHSKSEEQHIKKSHSKKHREKNDSFHKLDPLLSKPAAISNTKDSYSIPFIDFGKTDWAKYFGDIGVEPPLPKNIEEILNEPCYFWPNKKVKETHLLVLIPYKVNGKPFTLNYLGELAQKPKSGYATTYAFYSSCVKEVVGDKSYPSHWVLMTRYVIPDSKCNGKSSGCNMIVNHIKKTGLPYELPHELDAAACILMNYVKTGERLYNDDPWTYTYSKDVDKYGDPLAVGGFSSSGLHIYDGIGSGRGCPSSTYDGVAMVRVFR